MQTIKTFENTMNSILLQAIDMLTLYKLIIMPSNFTKKIPNTRKLMPIINISKKLNEIKHSHYSIFVVEIVAAMATKNIDDLNVIVTLI